jgi:hypothetical protein
MSLPVFLTQEGREALFLLPFFCNIFPGNALKTAFPARLLTKPSIFGAEKHFLIRFLSFPWITGEKRSGKARTTRKVEN